MFVSVVVVPGKPGVVRLEARLALDVNEFPFRWVTKVVDELNVAVFDKFEVLLVGIGNTYMIGLPLEPEKRVDMLGHEHLTNSVREGVIVVTKQLGIELR